MTYQQQPEAVTFTFLILMKFFTGMPYAILQPPKAESQLSILELFETSISGPHMIRISFPSVEDQLLISVLCNQTMNLKFCFPFKRPNTFSSLLLWLIQEKCALKSPMLFLLQEIRGLYFHSYTKIKVIYVLSSPSFQFISYGAAVRSTLAYVYR